MNLFPLLVFLRDSIHQHPTHDARCVVRDAWGAGASASVGVAVVLGASAWWWRQRVRVLWWRGVVGVVVLASVRA